MPYELANSTINKSDCIPDVTMPCNTTTEFDVYTNLTGATGLVTASDLSEYLCYLQVYNTTFNISTYYDNYSWIALQHKGPKIVPACRATLFYSHIYASTITKELP